METVIVRNGLYQVGAQGAQFDMLADMANAAASYFKCNLEDICIDFVKSTIPTSGFDSSFLRRLDDGFCSFPTLFTSDASCPDDTPPDMRLAFDINFALCLHFEDILMSSVFSSFVSKITVDVNSGGGSAYHVVSVRPNSYSLKYGNLYVGGANLPFPAEMLSGGVSFYYYRAYNKNRV